MDAEGAFVVSWMQLGANGWHIWARRYTQRGEPIGGEFQVNTYTGSYQIFPTVAVDAHGEFVVTWMSLDRDGSGYGVYHRRYRYDLP
jgi:hypothetical protein